VKPSAAAIVPSATIVFKFIMQPLLCNSLLLVLVTLTPNRLTDPKPFWGTAMGQAQVRNLSDAMPCRRCGFHLAVAGLYARYIYVLYIPGGRGATGSLAFLAAVASYPARESLS
jgi:hypothetical protein